MLIKNTSITVCIYPVSTNYVKIFVEVQYILKNFVMSPVLVSDLLREMLYVTLKITAPFLITALVVGIVISLLQALIQVQEQTLTFVPKMLAIFACLVLMMGFIADSFLSFSHHVYSYIVQVD